MLQKLDHYFEITQRDSTFRREILGGVTTFMAMAYILAVQPSLMSVAKMPVDSVIVGVSIASGLATLFMGIYAKYPFALAPGMGTNIFFAFTLVGSGLLVWQQAMALVFLAGVLFTVLTIFGFREAIAEALPASIKLGIGSSVGIFLVYLGAKSAGIMSISETGISKGDFLAPQTLLSIIGFFITTVLITRKVHGSLLIGILITTLLGIPFGVTKIPDVFFTSPPSIAPVFMQLDFSGLISPDTLPFIFVFFIGDFFSTLGTLLGVSSKAGFLDENGNLPHIEKPFLVDALATVCGSLLGSTTITTFVESASGVAAGARTGFASVITSLCFFLAIFCTPLFLMIPSAATAPCLIIIGFMLLDGLRHFNFGVLDDTIAPLSMLTITAFTASMSNGISVGILVYVFIKLAKGEFNKVTPLMYILCGILGYYLIS